MPLVNPYDIGQSDTREPAGGFQFRLPEKARDIAYAKVGNRLARWRDSESISQIIMPEDTHPTNADIFRSGCQPEVLYGADGAVEVHFVLMCPPYDNGTRSASVTSDADADGRLQDTLQFERAVGLLPLVLEHLGGVQVCGLEGISHLLLDRGISDNNEIPGLHEANRRCMVCRTEKACQPVIRDRVWKKLPAYITAIEDAFVNGFPLGGRELDVSLNVVGFHGIPFMGKREHRSSTAVL